MRREGGWTDERYGGRWREGENKEMGEEEGRLRGAGKKGGLGDKRDE